MTYIDTHAHLYSEKFEEDRDEMIQRALDAGVKKLFLPNIDEASIEGMEALVNKSPGVCYSMMGVHPCYVSEDYEKELETTKKWFSKRNYCAVSGTYFNV